MRSDAIIVLGGNVNPDGSLSRLSKSRVEKGVGLFKKHVAPRMIMSGSLSFLATYIPKKTEALTMKGYASQLGVRELPRVSLCAQPVASDLLF